MHCRIRHSLFALAVSAGTILGFVADLAVAQGGAWYNDNWEYRQSITISNEMVNGTDQSDFPVLIAITNANAVFSRALADGSDIVFTRSDRITKLSHEIEKYDAGAEELWAWVKIPTLSASEDTVIHMYYDSPSAPDQQETTNVWDSSVYGMVQHLSETSGDHYDSTANDNDGTPLGGGRSGRRGEDRRCGQFCGSR